ncbi:MAG: OsmC family protein [Micromonosporaceae bacterium]
MGSRQAPRLPSPESSDPSFLGDAGRWNPEELLVASLSQCHMLWYLHLCADNGVVVTEYVVLHRAFSEFPGALRTQGALAVTPTPAIGAARLGRHHPPRPGTS